jgi:hypothetical protein
MSSSTTTAQNYTDGTLIIDAYDKTDKKMVWRGTGTVTVKAKPEKQIQQVGEDPDKDRREVGQDPPQPGKVIVDLI